MSGGLTSRMKGQRGEREVSAILRAHGFEARRGTQTRGGTEEPDVVCSLPGWEQSEGSRVEKREGELHHILVYVWPCDRGRLEQWIELRKRVST